MLRLLIAAAALLAVVLVLLAGSHEHTARPHPVQPGTIDGGLAPGAHAAALVISAVAEPAVARRLYPGTRGDAVLSVHNPNPFPVTVTGVWLPAVTSYAQGFADSDLQEPRAGCAAGTPSLVAWADARPEASEHVLSTALVLGPAGSPDATDVVTLRDAVSMAADAPSACAATFFKLPALAGIDAFAGGAPTGGPVTVTVR